MDLRDNTAAVGKRFCRLVLGLKPSHLFYAAHGFMRRTWLRHCPPRLQVSGSIRGGFLGKFQLTRSFCPHTAAMGSMRPLTEMSTKEFP